MATRLVKIDGNRLSFQSYNDNTHNLTGDLTGYVLTRGRLKVKGDYLQYGDYSHHERRLLGMATEYDWAGNLRIKGAHLYYKDYSDIWRCIPRSFSTVHDDLIQGASTNYTTAHNAASGNILPYARFGQRLYLDVNYYVIRLPLVFNTAGLPDDCTINSAYIHFKLHEVNPGYDESAGPDFDVIAVQGDTIDVPPVATDYGDLLSKTVSRGSANRTVFESSGNGLLPLNETGISEISKSGYTKFGIRTSRDISSSPPTDNNEFAGGGNISLLVIYE